MPDAATERPSKHYPQFVENLPSMAGKTVAVTGCSRGLGYVTARTLASKGAKVYMLNRKSDRSEQARDAIAAEARTAEGGPPPPQLVECDLLDFSSVRSAALALRESAPDGIDVLCCNAGVMLQPDETSADGYDITVSTNVLSHFLLTRELLPLLERAAEKRGEARIVNMSSRSGFGPPAFDPNFFDRRGGDLGGSRSSYERYHQSKLANIAFTSALDDKLRARGSSVKALACTPGVCGTDMFLHASAVMNGRPSRRDAVPSAEDGCIAQLKCVCDPTVVSGDLWGPRMGGGGGGELVKVDIAPPTVLVDDEVKDVLWDVCQKAVGSFDI